MESPHSPIRAACVFCGSADNLAQPYQDAAAGLGRALADAGIRLVYGGEKSGLLGLLANACLGAGGAVTGIIPAEFLRRGLAHGGVGDMQLVRDLHERKSRMAQLAQAFIVMPGGLGTLDEAVDALATKYGGEHQKPVVFVNTGNYYAPLFAMIDHMIAGGFASAKHHSLYRVAATPEEAVAFLAVR